MGSWGILLTVTGTVIVLGIGCTPAEKSEPARTDAATADTSTDTSSSTPALARIELTSNAFANDSLIPAKYTCDGASVSPHIAWGMLPSGTKTLTIICEDIDAPGGPWTHWVIYNIPPQHQQDLPESVPTGLVFPNEMRQGLNDFGRIGWGGPCPPPGNPHRYVFKLYLLNSILHVPGPADKATILSAMEGRVIGEGQLVGVYGRSE